MCLVSIQCQSSATEVTQELFLPSRLKRTPSTRSVVLLDPSCGHKVTLGTSKWRPAALMSFKMRAHKASNNSGPFSNMTNLHLQLPGQNVQNSKARSAWVAHSAKYVFRRLSWRRCLSLTQHSATRKVQLRRSQIASHLIARRSARDISTFLQQLGAARHPCDTEKRVETECERVTLHLSVRRNFEQMGH